MAVLSTCLSTRQRIKQLMRSGRGPSIHRSVPIYWPLVRTLRRVLVPGGTDSTGTVSSLRLSPWSLSSGKCQVSPKMRPTYCSTLALRGFLPPTPLVRCLPTPNTSTPTRRWESRPSVSFFPGSILGHGSKRARNHIKIHFPQKTPVTTDWISEVESPPALPVYFSTTTSKQTRRLSPHRLCSPSFFTDTALPRTPVKSSQKCPSGVARPLYKAWLPTHSGFSAIIRPLGDSIPQRKQRCTFPCVRTSAAASVNYRPPSHLSQLRTATEP
jgi:hypothetical protein